VDPTEWINYVLPDKGRKVVFLKILVENKSRKQESPTNM
jgi:hypothetical protein